MAVTVYNIKATTTTIVLECKTIRYLNFIPGWTSLQVLKCILQSAHIACSSKDVDALDFQLVRHDAFNNGQTQQDSTEFLLMLIDIINKGSMPDSSSTTYPTGASPFDILFSFVLGIYIVCDVCGLESSSFESSSMLYITPTDTSSMQDMVLQWMQQQLQKSCSRCNKNSYTSIRMHSLYEFCYRTYIDIHKECRSVLVKLHPITVYKTVCVQFICWMPLSVFCGLPIVSCSMKNSLILGCLRPLVSVSNSISTLGVWRSAVSHLRISDSTWCHRTPLCHIYLLNLDIMQGSFWLCIWLSLRRLVSLINHLLPVCWSTFWKSILNKNWAAGLTYCIVNLQFFVFWHMQSYMSWYTICSSALSLLFK